MPKSPGSNFNCDSEGISPPVAGALGTLIANEVITSILNLKSYLNGNILIYDALKTNFRKTKLSFNQIVKINVKNLISIYFFIFCWTTCSRQRILPNSKKWWGELEAGSFFWVSCKNIL